MRLHLAPKNVGIASGNERRKHPNYAVLRQTKDEGKFTGLKEIKTFLEFNILSAFFIPVNFLNLIKFTGREADAFVRLKLQPSHIPLADDFRN